MHAQGATMVALVSASVGKGGANVAADVRVVQHLLNDWLSRTGQSPLLAVDGIAGPKTDAAILAFQRSLAGVLDGRFDPTGPGLRTLFDQHISSFGAMMRVSRPYDVVISRNALNISLTIPSRDPLSATLDAYVQALRKA
jgi:peptidoglycan hydrolase-like protein with peptidoglycan-binding domain